MGGVVGIFAVFVVAGFVLWIWALVDAIQVPDDSMYQSGSKLIWVLVIVLAGAIGAVIYLIVGRPKPGAAPRQPPPPPGSLPPPPGR
jgi:hypothetical protein